MKDDFQGFLIGTTHQFLADFDFVRLEYNSFGAGVETYICTLKADYRKNKDEFLVESLARGKDYKGHFKIMAERYIDILKFRDPNVEGSKYLNKIIRFYIGDKRAFVVHSRASKDEVTCDLYDFANRKGAFTEYEIGLIANQLLQGVKNIHK